MPEISVCVPTRNRAAELRQTLRAMQSQTLPYAELIVGDDASEDDTEDVVRSFDDPRIRYVRHERNVGIYANWNDLISRCSGEYVCIYHDHDHYLSTILETSASLLESNPEMSFAHTALAFANRAGGLVDIDIRSFPSVMSGHDLRLILANGWHSPVMAATAMVRRSAYQRVGPYQYEEYGLGCDKHMWFQLARVGVVGYVSRPQALIQVRERGIGTAKPSWSNEFGSLRMRAEEIEELYAEDASAQAKASRAMVVQRNRRLLALAVRSLLLDDPEEWALHEEKVTELIGGWPSVFYLLAKHCPPVRMMLRSVGLPIHYSRIARAERRASVRASSYNRQHSLLGKPERESLS